MGDLRGSRAAVIGRIADEVLALPDRGVRRVAVDGVDGAGKTYFADELAAELTARGVPVIRASVDRFHNPADVRYSLGRASPQGYFRDSYDYDGLVALLLEPLSPGGSGRFLRAAYDWQSERAVTAPPETAEPGSVLVFDGIFLHRPELAQFWDYSIFLDVPFAVSIPRGAQRGYGDPDPAADANRRYVEGQRLYLTECRPVELATVVIDNTDLAQPVVR